MGSKTTYSTLAQTDTESENTNFEVCSSELSDKTCVVGRLKKHSDFWRNTLKAPSFVQNIIDFGYVIPFNEFPKEFCEKNNASSLKHKDFVDEAILKLLKNKCITELKKRAKILQSSYCGRK